MQPVIWLSGPPPPPPIAASEPKLELPPDPPGLQPTTPLVATPPPAKPPPPTCTLTTEPVVTRKLSCFKTPPAPPAPLHVPRPLPPPPATSKTSTLLTPIGTVQVEEHVTVEKNFTICVFVATSETKFSNEQAGRTASDLLTLRGEKIEINKVKTNIRAIFLEAL